MKLEIEIIPEAVDSGKLVLLAEVADSGCSFLFYYEDYKTLVGLLYYRFEPGDRSDTIHKAFSEIIANELFSGSFKNVRICYCYRKSVLIPEVIYTSENSEDFVELVHGDLNKGTLLIDKPEGHNVLNIFRVPLEVHALMSAKFSEALFVHQNTLLLKSLSVEKHKMTVIVYPDALVIALVKNGLVQIIQSFPYKTTDDAAYHLLNTCQLFEVQNIHLEMSGFIEKDFRLYREIRNYFVSVSFLQYKDEVTLAEGFKKFPAHYFSHLMSIPA